MRRHTGIFKLELFFDKAFMKFQQTQIISFVNQKGGCGKTSSSVSVAAAFAQLGYSVCLVDSDAQCNSSDSLGVNPDDTTNKVYTLADIYLSKAPASEVEIKFDDRFGGRLTLIAGHKGLKSVEKRLDKEKLEELANDYSSILDSDDITNEHRFRLRDSLASLRGKHDLVIIDTPPDLGFEMTTSLIASDWFIIPVFASGYDMKGLETLVKTVEKVKQRYNPKLQLAGVLLGNFDKSAKLDRDIHNLLIRKFGDNIVFNTTISRSVKHREATIYRRTIFEHAPNDQSSLQYLDLVKELLNRGTKSPRGLTDKTLPDENALGRIKNARIDGSDIIEEGNNSFEGEVVNG